MTKPACTTPPKALWLYKPFMGPFLRYMEKETVQEWVLPIPSMYFIDTCVAFGIKLSSIYLKEEFCVDLQHVANMMLRMKREFAGIQNQILPVFDTLLLLDRNVDLLTPLATQLTYEGLIDEIYGINNGQKRVSICYVFILLFVTVLVFFQSSRSWG